jgi:hypothetical protein
MRIYRGIVARWKADGPEEQIGVNKTRTGQKAEYTGEYKIISTITQPVRIFPVIVQEN